MHHSYEIMIYKSYTSQAEHYILNFHWQLAIGTNMFLHKTYRYSTRITRFCTRKSLSQIQRRSERRRNENDIAKTNTRQQLMLSRSHLYFSLSQIILTTDFGEFLVTGQYLGISIKKWSDVINLTSISFKEWHFV